MIKKINESGYAKDVSDLFQPLKNIVSFTNRFDTMLSSIRIDAENVLDNLSNVPDHFSARRKFDEIDSVIQDMNSSYANLVRAGKKLNELLLDTRNKYGNRNRTEGMSDKTKRYGRKLKESNDFVDEDIVMYYKGKKIFEGGSDELGVKVALSDLMYDDDKFYQDAKDFLENELGIEVTDIDDCAYTLADQIDTEATYADSIESFYIPFGEFEAFFKADEALT